MRDEGAQRHEPGPKRYNSPKAEHSYAPTRTRSGRDSRIAEVSLSPLCEVVLLNVRSLGRGDFLGLHAEVALADVMPLAAAGYSFLHLILDSDRTCKSPYPKLKHHHLQKL